MRGLVDGRVPPLDAGPCCSRWSRPSHCWARVRPRLRIAPMPCWQRSRFRSRSATMATARPPAAPGTPASSAIWLPRPRRPWLAAARSSRRCAPRLALPPPSSPGGFRPLVILRARGPPRLRTSPACEPRRRPRAPLEPGQDREIHPLPGSAPCALALPTMAGITATGLRGRSVTLEAPAEHVLLGFNYEDFLAVAGPGGERRSRPSRAGPGRTGALANGRPAPPRFPRSPTCRTWGCRLRHLLGRGGHRRPARSCHSRRLAVQRAWRGRAADRGRGHSGCRDRLQCPAGCDPSRLGAARCWCWR